jgi:hypothetical protein
MSDRFAYARRLTASDALVISAIDGIAFPYRYYFVSVNRSNERKDSKRNIQSSSANGVVRDNGLPAK